MAENRKSGLTTLQLHLLDAACIPLREAFGFGSVYLVGTAQTGGEYRDVDVRVILHDDEFDRMFQDKNFWTLVCTSIAWRLTVQTSLPVDFQIQRMTEANENHQGPRNPLGTGRVYAGGGDATPFDAMKVKKADAQSVEADGQAHD